MRSTKCNVVLAKTLFPQHLSAADARTAFLTLHVELDLIPGAKEQEV